MRRETPSVPRAEALGVAREAQAEPRAPLGKAGDAHVEARAARGARRGVCRRSDGGSRHTEGGARRAVGGGRRVSGVSRHTERPLSGHGERLSARRGRRNARFASRSALRERLSEERARRGEFVARNSAESRRPEAERAALSKCGETPTGKRERLSANGERLRARRGPLREGLGKPSECLGRILSQLELPAGVRGVEPVDASAEERRIRGRTRRGGICGCSGYGIGEGMTCGGRSCRSRGRMGLGRIC